MTIVAFFLTFACVMLATTVFRRRESLALAYLEGKRAGLKLAISTAKERGDVAVLVAPKGLLLEGIGRAQTAHQIERDLHGLLAETR
jgi:hypothetical protein